MFAYHKIGFFGLAIFNTFIIKVTYHSVKLLKQRLDVFTLDFKKKKPSMLHFFFRRYFYVTVLNVGEKKMKRSTTFNN